MSGTMIIGAVTGGMQDQMRFEDENGKWIEFDSKFPSNHRGTYKKHGEWAEPVFPSNISLAGSPMTPYIFDDRSSPEDVADAIKKVYDLPKEERDRRGLVGSEWTKSDEAQMTADQMCTNMIDSIEETFKKFKPRKRFDVIKVGGKKSVKVTHALTGY